MSSTNTIDFVSRSRHFSPELRQRCLEPLPLSEHLEFRPTGSIARSWESQLLPRFSSPVRPAGSTLETVQKAVKDSTNNCMRDIAAAVSHQLQDGLTGAPAASRSRPVVGGPDDESTAGDRPTALDLRGLTARRDRRRRSEPNSDDEGGGLLDTGWPLLPNTRRMTHSADSPSIAALVRAPTAHGLLKPTASTLPPISNPLSSSSGRPPPGSEPSALLTTQTTRHLNPSVSLAASLHAASLPPAPSEPEPPPEPAPGKPARTKSLKATAAPSQSAPRGQKDGSHAPPGGRSPSPSAPRSGLLPVHTHSRHLQKIGGELERLKADPQLMQRLQQRVADYQEAVGGEEARADFVGANKQRMVQLRPEQRLQELQQRSRLHDERLEQVQRAGKQRQAERQAAKVVASSRESMRAAAAAEAEKEARQWARKLAVLVCVVGRAAGLAQLLEMHRRTERQKEERHHASVVIQSHWRGYIQLMKYRKAIQALVKLQRFVRRKLCHTHQAALARRREAADVLLAFLKDLAARPRMAGAINKARKQVRSEHRDTSGAEIVRSAQTLVLVRAWEVAEEKLLAMVRKQRTHGHRNMATPPPKTGYPNRRRTDQGPPGGRSSPALLIPAVPGSMDDAVRSMQCTAQDRVILEALAPVPCPVKASVVRAFVKQKSRAYVVLLGCYWREKAQWQRQKREYEVLNAAKAVVLGSSDGSAAAVHRLVPPCPVRPSFRPQATVMELKAMMQQGVHETPFYNSYLHRLSLEAYLSHKERGPTPTSDRRTTRADAEGPEQWVQATLQRIHLCLRKRFVMLKVDLVASLWKASSRIEVSDQELRDLLHNTANQ